MEMTNALNISLMKSFQNLFLYQLLSKSFSNPGRISNTCDEALPLYQVEREQQNFQSLTITHRDTFWKNKFSQYSFVKTPNYLVSIPEQLKLITAFFGFSKSKLGEILNVSRQSVYNWNNNIDEPDLKHSKKIKCLADVAFDVDPQPSQQIFHVYLYEVIQGYSKSLIDYLLDDNFDKEIITKLSKTLYEMSKARWNRIDEMPKAKYGVDNSNY